jgi:hypothetical protein
MADPHSTQSDGLDQVPDYVRRDARVWDIAEAYALAFGHCAVLLDVDQLGDLEHRLSETINDGVKPEVRAIAIEALARARDRARRRARHG